jgi:hypothetical protein
MGDEPDIQEEEDGLTTLDELEDSEEGPGIWFIMALLLGIGAVFVILGMLIFWLIGMAQTPSPLLR